MNVKREAFSVNPVHVLPVWGYKGSCFSSNTTPLPIPPINSSTFYQAGSFSPSQICAVTGEPCTRETNSKSRPDVMFEGEKRSGLNLGCSAIGDVQALRQL
ncbi:hypothetical protein EYF80_032211 [Liparis tanakae]|uniref:Uncharacterized protein n=1 Tax=Liparis tanakae TaxID=230148 RepID=A0A4Z2GVX7_9TELE|nr:hypothetical protein EYF80_032211 [Liparis tanakae]